MWLAPVPAGHPPLPALDPPRPEPDLPPQAPMFTASVDGVRGTIRIRGRVDRVAADVVTRGVVALHEKGHRHIVVQSLTPDVLDPGARRVLDDLAQRLWARGVQLSLE